MPDDKFRLANLEDVPVLNEAMTYGMLSQSHIGLANQPIEAIMPGSSITFSMSEFSLTPIGKYYEEKTSRIKGWLVICRLSGNHVSYSSLL